MILPRPGTASTRPGVKALLVSVAVLGLAACGSRVDHADVVRAGGEPTVRLDPGSIAALRAPRSPAISAPAMSPVESTDAAPPASSERQTAPDPRTRLPSAAARPRAQRSPAPAGATTTSCTSPRSPVALGQVGTFSGVAGPITADARSTMAVWARDLNARGGLACHPVTLYTVDDGGDPARASAAVTDLIGRHHIAALVGNIITFSASGFRAAVESAHVPGVGGDNIAPDWHQSPWLFPAGSGLDDQVLGLLRAAVAAGHKRVGYLYCVEVSGCGYIDKRLRAQAASVGAKVIYDAPISVTQPDFTAQCVNARDAGVDLLGLGMDGASMTRVGRSCAAIGYRPLLAVGAAALSLANAADPNLRAFGAIAVTPVAPWFTTDNPGVRAFHDALRRYAPDIDPDGAAILAWSAGKLLEAAINGLTPTEQSGTLTPELVTKGLDAIHDDNLNGLTTHLSFSPGKPAPSSGCVFFERLGPSGWSAPNGSRPVCR
jgi:branched-chain amino acid transport system substrate-binding protein